MDGQAVTPLFMLDGAVEHDPAVDAWLRAHDDDLGAIAGIRAKVAH